VLCENCHKSFATVHVSGWQLVPAGLGKRSRKNRYENHFCARCAQELKQTNPSLNPLLRAEPGAKRLSLRVVSLSGNHVKVRGIKQNGDLSQEEWMFLSSRLPAQYAVQGTEFDMILTEQKLRWLQGEDRGST